MFSFFKNDEFAADFYIDLGTANTLIAGRGKGIVVNEPTMIAFSEISPGKRKLIAVGLEAQEKISKTPGNMNFIRPLREGVIADYDTTETMLRYFMSRPRVKSFASRPRVVISIPYGVTEVEKRAVIEAGKSAGAKQVFLIDEPMASAIGAGLNIKDAKGCMIVDIGGGTTEVAVIALADIVYCQAIRIGGNKFDEAIVDYMKNKKNLIITETTAEQLKIQIGTAVPKKDIRSSEISGRDTNTGLTRSLDITSEEVGNAMDGCMRDIINAIHLALENTPPELISDIIDSGIMLAGGGALVRGIDSRLQSEIRLPVKICKNPLLAIAVGGEMVLSDPDLLTKIQLES